MSENKVNPALAHMDLAQNEIATYALLLKRAQSSLIASSQAFERANENSIAGNCQVRQELTNNLRGQYAALANLTDAIVGTLDAPTFSRIIATAPNSSPQLLALLEILPKEEKDLLNVAITALFVQGRCDITFLSQEQAELARKILPLT